MFLGCKGHTWAVTIGKSKKNYQVWSQKGSTFFLNKMPHFGQKPRPGESDPYVFHICIYLRNWGVEGAMCKILEFLDQHPQTKILSKLATFDLILQRPHSALVHWSIAPLVY